MKQILILLTLGLALSLCNLSSRFGGGGGGASDQPGTPSGDATETVEPANPTAAQMAAIAGGQNVKWDAQGMSWTVPGNWTETTNESKQLIWRSPGGSDAANLIVSISPMAESFPTEVSLKAYYDGARDRMKNGEVDEVKWVEIDGVKGVQFREAKPEKPDDFRRLHWMTYRKYAGQVQFVNVMVSSNGRGFEKQQDAMYGVLYSTKLVH